MKALKLIFAALGITLNLLNAQTLTNRDVYGTFTSDDIIINQRIFSDCNLCTPRYEKPYRVLCNNWDTTSIPEHWIGYISAVYDCSLLRVINADNDTLVYYSYNNQPDQTVNFTLDLLIDSTYSPIQNVIPEYQNYSNISNSSCNGPSLSLLYNNTNMSLNQYNYTRTVGGKDLGTIVSCDSIITFPGTFQQNIQYGITNQVININNGDTCRRTNISLIDDIKNLSIANINAYNFDVNDEFLYSHYYGSHTNNGGWSSSTDYEHIKIIGKEFINDTVKYAANVYYVDYDQNGAIINDTFISNIVFNYPINGYVEIVFPESYQNSDGINTIYKDNICGYNQLWWNYLTNDIYPSDVYYKYGEGLGLVEYRNNTSAQYSIADRLVYFKKNGIECGEFYPLSNENIQFEEKVQLYPTYTNDVINLYLLSNISANYSLKVIDTFGRLIKNLGIIQLGENTNNATLDVSDLPMGIYFLQLQSNSGSLITKKFYKN